MNKIRLLALALATVATAGPLRFHPDTIRTGERYYGSKAALPESTEVVNTSASYVTLTISSIVSQLSHASDEVMFDAPRLLAFTYSVDSSIKTGEIFRQPVSRAKVFTMQGRLELNRNFGSSEIRLAPHDSVKLGVFRFRSCLQLPVRALATTTPIRACNDEPIDLVFGTIQQGFDTLHTRHNYWSNGLGAVLPSNKHFPSPWDDRRYSLDGKLTPQTPTTITVAPTGSKLLLR